MSAAPKMTPWFVNGEVPWEPGVYNVSCRKQDQTGTWFAHWNGEAWGYGDTSPEAVQQEGYGIKPLHWSETGSWRGLAEKPE